MAGPDEAAELFGVAVLGEELDGVLDEGAQGVKLHRFPI